MKLAYRYKDITTGQGNFRNVTATNNYISVSQNQTDINLEGNVPTSNVIDLYDQIIGDYTTPTSDYASGSINGTLARDTNGVNQQGSGSSNSFTLTIGNNQNRLLVVGVSLFIAGTPPTISSVTYNSVAMTLLPGSMAVTTGTNNNRVATYYLIAPATGAHTLTATFSGSATDSAVGWLSVYNADQVKGMQSGNSTFHNSGSSSIVSVITPRITGSWTFMQSAATSVSSQTLSDTQDWANSVGAVLVGQHRTNPTIGSKNTMSTGISSVEWASSGGEIIPGTSIYQAIDNLLTTEWKSKPQSNPYLAIDTGSSQILSALAIYPDTTHTNCTQIKIMTSNDNSTWTTKRTINFNLFTNATWQFVRWDLDNNTQRWIKDYCTDNGIHQQLAIVETKALIPSSTQMILRHGHEYINPSDGTLSLNK